MKPIGDWSIDHPGQDNEPEQVQYKTTGFDWDKVTRFNFTYAIPDGAWIETTDGYRNWFSFDYIAKHKGQAWIDRQLRKQGWMTGCWVEVS